MVALEGNVETSKSDILTQQLLFVTNVPGITKYPALVADSFHVEGAPQLVLAPVGPYIPQPSSVNVVVVPTSVLIVICSELSGSKL